MFLGMCVESYMNTVIMWSLRCMCVPYIKGMLINKEVREESVEEIIKIILCFEGI